VSDPTLLIVHVEPPGGADGLYRTIQPCRALGELDQVAVVSGPLLSPALGGSPLLDEADLLVIRDAGDPDLLPIIEGRRRRQRLTAYEIGSHLLAPPPADEPAPRARDLVSRSLPPQLARQADCLQLATVALDQRFGHLNPRRAVFPSNIWEVTPPPIRPPDRVIIGWGGSLGHREDLRSALPALRGVLERHAEVGVAIMGDPAMRAVLAELPAGRATFSASGSVESYTRFLAGVDIGIAPLLPTEYNRCRSDVRFVEYAAHQVLAVCADLEPYQAVVHPGQTGFTFRDVAELETVLERALAEGELCTAIKARAARYVATERLERRHAGERLGFYLSVATQLGFRLAPGRPLDWGAWLQERLAPRTFSGSRYMALGAGDIERLLEEGLARQHAGAVDEACALYAEAARRAPTAYRAELLRGTIHPDAVEAVRALARAEALNPRSCEAPFRLGERLSEAGDHPAAAAAYQRARAVAPTFGAPQARLGDLAQLAGRVEEACGLYEEAALQNSAFALPIARLATVALQSGRIEKAVGLLERSLESDPHVWLTNFLVGRVYVELKRHHQARVHLARALEGDGPAPAAEDRVAILTEMAKAEMGLGNLATARTALEEARRSRVD
jgi:tetratricopeptide (TPR) repeat protein